MAIFETFSCQVKSSYIKHLLSYTRMHILDFLWMSLYKNVKRPFSFPAFVSTYVSRFNPSDQLLYNIGVLLQTKDEPRPDAPCLWHHALSDKFSYVVPTKFPDKEWDKMNARELPTVLLSPFKCRNVMWAA